VFKIAGDFRLDTNQSTVDLETELNKVDILNLKFEKIQLAFDQIARGNNNPIYLQLQGQMASFLGEIIHMNKYLSQRHIEFQKLQRDYS
jgi:hypothetical protein